MRTGIIAILVAFCLVFGARAAEPERYEVPTGHIQGRLPAVSGVNGKLSVLGGLVDGNALGAVAGSVTVPVPFVPFLGVQIDALGGTWDADRLAAAALHIFARDPSVGLIGAYGDWTYVSPEHYGRVGAELEVYFGQFSFEAVVGGSFGQNVRDSFFDEFDLAFYATDQLRLSAGHVYSQLGHQAKVSAEYLLPLQTPVGISTFLEGRAGEGEYAAVWGGVRLYISPEQKSLIRRHREDDPQSRLPSSIAPLTNCGYRPGSSNFCGRDRDLSARP